MKGGQGNPETTGKRVLVCGGRDYNDLGAVWSQLDAWHALQGPIALVIHGGARGADALAGSWAASNSIPVLEFKISQNDWQQYSGAAGPMRNRRMLDEGMPDLVIVFPGGNGTANMINEAKKRNVQVEEPYAQP